MKVGGGPPTLKRTTTSDRASGSIAKSWYCFSVKAPNRTGLSPSDVVGSHQRHPGGRPSNDPPRNRAFLIKTSCFLRIKRCFTADYMTGSLSISIRYRTAHIISLLRIKSDIDGRGDGTWIENSSKTLLYITINRPPPRINHSCVDQKP